MRRKRNGKGEKKKRKAINKIRAKKLGHVKLTYRQEEDIYLKEAIVDFMFDNSEPMTVSDILENIPALEGEENTRVSSLLRQLLLDEVLEKYSENRRTYFRIPQ